MRYNYLILALLHIAASEWEHLWHRVGAQCNCAISSSVDVMSQLDSLASQVEVLWVGRWLGERPKCSSKERH